MIAFQQGARVKTEETTSFGLSSQLLRLAPVGKRPEAQQILVEEQRSGEERKDEQRHPQGGGLHAHVVVVLAVREGRVARLRKKNRAEDENSENRWEPRCETR